MCAASSWTDERVQSLRTFWREGLSASQIAMRLAGGVTRNAVIGKIHRLGLSGRAAPARPAARRTRREARPLSVRQPSSQAAAPAVRSVLVAAPELTEVLGLASVLTIGARACRWPIGDPIAESFTLCGRPACRGAYCAEHGAVAYRRADKDHLMRLAGLT